MSWAAKTLSHWNYRVLRHRWEGESYLCIHEVYYNENGTVNSWTANPVNVMSENPQGLSCTLKWMRRALKKPILMEVEGKLVEAAPDGKWVQPEHRRKPRRGLRQLCDFRPFMEILRRTKR